MAGVVQHKSGDSGGSSTGFSLTFDSSTVNGRAIAVCVTIFQFANTGTVTVSDNKGNTYTAGPTADFGSFENCWWFYCVNATGGASHQVTSSLSTAGFHAMTIHELSDIAAAGQPGPTNSADDGAQLTTHTSGQITTDSTDQIVLGGFAPAHNPGSWAAGSGWTLAGNHPAFTTMAIATAYKAVASSGSAQNPTVTSGSASQAMGATLTLYGSGGGGGGATSLGEEGLVWDTTVRW